MKAGHPAPFGLRLLHRRYRSHRCSHSSEIPDGTPLRTSPCPRAPTIEQQIGLFDGRGILERVQLAAAFDHQQAIRPRDPRHRQGFVEFQLRENLLRAVGAGDRGCRRFSTSSRGRAPRRQTGLVHAGFRPVSPPERRRPHDAEHDRQDNEFRRSHRDAPWFGGHGRSHGLPQLRVPSAS